MYDKTIYNTRQYINKLYKAINGFYFILLFFVYRLITTKEVIRDIKATKVVKKGTKVIELGYKGVKR
nr:MAG TPA: hypothetical protein [Caudoviricetes sp.]